MKTTHRMLILSLALVTPVVAAAQDYAPYAEPMPVAVSYASPMQLDQMLAPVALYPDLLLGQILVAATYPLQIAEAARWQRYPDRVPLRQKPWDDSVKALVYFPQVLHTLNGNIDWTQQVGRSFLAQQGDVVDAVQRLRWRAQQNGALGSNRFQTVIVEDNNIAIESTQPDAVSIPVYNPALVYGMWPYPQARPYAFVETPTVVVEPAPVITLVQPIWRAPWDWGHRRLDDDRFTIRHRDESDERDHDHDHDDHVVVTHTVPVPVATPPSVPVPHVPDHDWRNEEHRGVPKDDRGDNHGGDHRDAPVIVALKSPPVAQPAAPVHAPEHHDENQDRHNDRHDDRTDRNQGNDEPTPLGLKR